MRSKHILATLVGVVVTAGLLVTAAPVRAAVTHCVKLDGAGPCHDTIQEAVDAAGADDTIKIAKGTYFENVNIGAGKDGLVLTGKKAIIDPDDPNAGDAFSVFSNNVVFSKLIIRHGNDDGIFVSSTKTGTQVLGMQFIGQDGDCIDSDGSALTVHGSTFVGCGSNAIDANLSNHVITGNTMRKCGSACINLGDEGVEAHDVLVEDNSIIQAGRGIDIEGNGADVLDNELENISGIGIEVVGSGVNGLITGNALLNIGDAGILAEDLNGGLVEDNDLENTGDGIDIQDAQFNLRVLGNSVTNARGDGIRVDGTGVSAPLVEDNEVEIADGTGIWVEADENPRVLDNDVSITGTGFVIACTGLCGGGLIEANSSEDAFDEDAFAIGADAPGLRVLDNEAVQSQNNGFVIGGTGIIAEDNTAEDAGEDASDDGFRVGGTGHQLRRNEVEHSADDGFDICGDNHVLEENVSTDNIEDGFDVHGEVCSGQSDGVQLTANEATDNLAIGIEISTDGSPPGANGTTLSGNVASGNQRGDYCDEGTATVLNPDNEFEVTTPPPCPVD